MGSPKLRESQAAAFDRVRRPQEAASTLGVSTKTLRRLELRGKIRRTQISERIYGFVDSEIQKVIDGGRA